MPLKYSDLMAGDVLLKHSAGTKTKFIPMDADYRHISPKAMLARLNKSADRSHPGRIIG